MSTPPFTEVCALVTGASSGIGRALALELARRRAKIALVGRDAGRLAETRKLCLEAGAARAEGFDVDLTNLARIEALVGEAEQRLGEPVRLMIHAAGEVLVAKVEDYPLDRAQALLDVNLLAGFALARALIPRMRKQGGTLGFISSGAAFRAVPFQWAYAASKAGIERMAEALRVELTGTGIKVRVASPGPVDTAMNNDPPTVGNARMLSGAKGVPSPEQIAPAILAAFAGRKARVDLTLRPRLVRWLAVLGAEPLDTLLRRTMK